MKVNRDIEALVTAYCRTIINIKETIDSYKLTTYKSSNLEKAKEYAKRISMANSEGYLRGVALSIFITTGTCFSAPGFYLSKDTNIDEMKLVISWTDESLIHHEKTYLISNITKYGYEEADTAAKEMIYFINS